MKQKFLQTSIVLSIISITITLLINIQIAKEYLRSDGKTRALFGIKELLQYGYQYYVLILGVCSLILAIMNLKGNIQTNKKAAVVLLSILAIIIVFVRIWRLFVSSIP